MQPFSYVEGTSTQAAVSQFTPSASQYLAGGTTLIDLMKLHVIMPSQLIALEDASLRKVEDLGSVIEVGALVTNNQMAHHPLIAKNFPLVSEALLSGASVQLRNLATTSGNILQKTRCAYFRDVTARCNKRNPGSGCDALEGYNRMHAILGGSDRCIASHPSDLCVALMAIDATVQVSGRSGAREIAFGDFFKLPGQTPEIENALLPGELITSVRLPKHPWFKRSVYVKIRDRSSYAFALTSAAVALEFDGSTIKQARIAFGGIGAIPWRAREAEAVLTGHALSDARMKEAAHATLAHAVPSAYNAFKVPLAEQTLIRALREAEQKS